MKDIYKEEEFEIPDGVTVNVKSRLVTVKGPRGELKKNLRHIDMEIKKIGDKKIKLIVWHGSRKHVACLRTVRSLIVNMINGVTKVFILILRLQCSWCWQKLTLLGIPLQNAICLCTFSYQCQRRR